MLFLVVATSFPVVFKTFTVSVHILALRQGGKYERGQ
jgi:hypothetical protein